MELKFYFNTKPAFFLILKPTVLILCIILFYIIPPIVSEDFDLSTCNLSVEIKKEILTYIPIVEKFKKAIKGPFQNKTYNDMEDFIDTVGSRLSGSKGLDHAISYLIEKLKQPDTGIKFVKKEQVQVPKLKIGQQYAQLIKPRKQIFSILPSINSSNTPENGILAKALIVKSMRQLKIYKHMVFGKIIVLNFHYKNLNEYFGLKDKYILAIKEGYEMGAVAILIKTTTTLSLYSPKSIFYEKFFNIPIATITVEDAELLDRINARGEEIKIYLHIYGYSFKEGQKSYNIISDYEGTISPDEYIIISGHMDNVPVGLGAQDDAVGIFLSLNTIRLFNYLQLIPRRTVRLIFWTSEEVGLIGSETFLKTHHMELLENKYRAAMEADGGCTGLPRFITSLSGGLGCVLHEIMISVLKLNINDSGIGLEKGKTDVIGFEKFLIPYINMGGKLNESYWWYYHTSGDVMNHVDRKDMDTCLLMYSTVAFILSDMKTLPRTQ